MPDYVDWASKWLEKLSIRWVTFQKPPNRAHSLPKFAKNHQKLVHRCNKKTASFVTLARLHHSYRASSLLPGFAIASYELRSERSGEMGRVVAGVRDISQVCIRRKEAAALGLFRVRVRCERSHRSHKAQVRIQCLKCAHDLIRSCCRVVAG